MKIKDGFILRKVGIQYVVAATGKASEGFNGMMRLNETGAFAFRLLQEGISEEALVRGGPEGPAGVSEKTERGRRPCVTSACLTTIP